MVAEPQPLHVETAGEGPVCVWLHGFTGSARNWRPQLRWLRAHHRVIAYDQRGHARSPAPVPGRYDLAAFVADLGHILDEACPPPERALVGGLSLGAGVALAFAEAHPERVRALVLASPPGARGGAGGLAAHGLEMARVLEAEGAEAAGARFVWGPGSGFDPATARLVRQGFLEHDPLALAAILRGVLQELPERMASETLAARVTMPVLLVAGSGDPGSLASARALAQRLPDARLEVVEGAGHVVNIEAASAFDEIVRRFLAELGESGQGAAGR